MNSANRDSKLKTWQRVLISLGIIVLTIPVVAIGWMTWSHKKMVTEARGRITAENVAALIKYAERTAPTAPTDGMKWGYRLPDTAPEVAVFDPQYGRMDTDELHLMLIGGFVGLWLRLDRDHRTGQWEATAGIEEEEFPIPSN